MRSKKIHQKIKKYILANYSKINKEDMVLGEGIWNRRCHLNSVQKIKDPSNSEVVKVWLCVFIDINYNEINIHFINQLYNKKYQDNTLGWQYTYCDYYLIKEVDISEFYAIGELLENTKDSLWNLHSNWFDRNILKLKSNLI